MNNNPSTNSGFSYILNTTATSQGDASSTCNGIGGQLVAYRSLAEQVEVEGYFLQMGVLLPTFHKHYWTGLVSNNETWPRFNWTDKSVRPPSGITYIHWGRGEGMAEPNNNTGFEACGVANASQSFQEAWGWSDVQCGAKYVFICKIQSE
jgi:hypothetical protein